MSKNTKILVVDDEPVGRQLLEAILISEGYDIIFAENGQKAYDMASVELPDVILCDVMMPIMDGYEVCRKIRKNEDIAHTPVFLITALDDRDSRIKGIDAGADDYISKPFDRLEILAKIKNAANLLLVRKKTELEKNSGKTNKNNSNSYLAYLNALLTTILPPLENTDSKEYVIYRVRPVTTSCHAAWNIDTEKGKYICLVSNNLNEPDTVLVNGMISTIITKNILTTYSPSQVVQGTFNEFTNLTKKFKLAEIEHIQLNLILLFIAKNHEDIIVSGMNNVVYVAGGQNSFGTSSNRIEYQPYYLMGNQDININGSKNICLLSGNIQSLFSQPELLSFLNTNFIDSTKIDHKEILASKFGLSTDMICIHIGF